MIIASRHPVGLTPVAIEPVKIGVSSSGVSLGCEIQCRIEGHPAKTERL